MFMMEEDNHVDFLTQKNDLLKTNLRESDSAEKEIKKQGEGRDSAEVREYDYDTIRLKVRLDYRGKARPPRFFFGGKSSEEVAEAIREQKVAFWRNTPLQGIKIENIEVYEIFTVLEEYDDTEEEVTYAPIELTIVAASLEDCVYLISREEFRRVEILSPSQIKMSSKEVEKLFVKFSEFFRKLYMQ